MLLVTNVTNMLNVEPATFGTSVYFTFGIKIKSRGKSMITLKFL